MELLQELAPGTIESADDLARMMDEAAAEMQRQRNETLAHTLRSELGNHRDPLVRELVKLATELIRTTDEQGKRLAEARRELERVEAHTDKVQKVLDESMSLANRLAETNARLTAALAGVQPEAIDPAAVLDRAPQVGTLAKPDTRGAIGRTWDGYWDAWKEHPFLMTLGHVAGLKLAQTVSELNAARDELEESAAFNVDLFDALGVAQDENEALAAEAEIQVRELNAARDELEEAERRQHQTTEVHVHEAPRLDDAQFEALGGRLDRAVQTELRTNAKRYRGEKGDRGAKGQAGKQGRAGRNGKTVRTTRNVHHHHISTLKSEAQPQRAIEVRHTTHVLKPTQDVGPMTPGTRRLVDAINRLKGSK